MKSTSNGVQYHHQRYQSQQLPSNFALKSQNDNNLRLSKEPAKDKAQVKNYNQDPIAMMIQKYASQPSQSKTQCQQQQQQVIKQQQVISQVTQQQDLNKQHHIGHLVDAEAEDYETLQQQAYEYLQGDVEPQIQNQQRIMTYQHPQVSKTPNPFPYQNVVSTPTSLKELKTSKNQSLQILNHYNQQQRNPQLPLSQGFNSHNPKILTSQGYVKDKKKSISTVSSNSTTNATLTTTTLTSNPKRISAHMKPKEGHHKSQSLYNKKIVDIISGLQQSLGVIANNVQSSFNNEDIMKQQEQQKALLESALLAQRLAQMTESLKTGVQQKPFKQSDKRQSMKVNNKSGRSSMSNQGYQKTGYKTIEDSSCDNRKAVNQSSRLSMDVSQSKFLISKAWHQRKASEIPLASNKSLSLYPQKLTHHQLHQKSHAQTINSSVEEVHKKYAMNMSEIAGSQFQIKDLAGNYITNPAPVSAKNGKTVNAQVSQANEGYSKVYAQSSLGFNSSDMMNILSQPKVSITLQPSKKPDDKVQIKTKNSSKQLQINPNAQPIEMLLKSTASSPNLHGQASKNTVKLKTGQQSNSNHAFDFESLNSQQLIQSVLTQNCKAISNKKNLILQKGEQNKGDHKRASSDGSSLTKMFHFKQQIMLNKMFQLSQDNSGATSANITHIKKTKKTPMEQLNQEKMIALSTLTSKRVSSNFDNQENLMAKMNYKSPKQSTQGQSQNKQPQKSLEVQAFLRKFTLKANQSVLNQVPQSLDQKKRQSGSIHKVQDMKLYKSSENPIQAQPQVQSHQSPSDPINLISGDKLYSQQIKKSNQPSNKRTSSDASKAQSNLLKKQQELMNQYKPESKKLQIDSLVNKYKSLNSVPLQPQIYSARQSPTTYKNTYYNFEDLHNSQASNAFNADSFIPTARSEQTFKPQGKSNQTTQKKLQQKKNEVVCSSINRLVQGDQRIDFLNNYPKQVGQSQQAQKLVSIFYEESDVKRVIKSPKFGQSQSNTMDENQSMVLIQHPDSKGYGSDYVVRKIDLPNSKKQSPKVPLIPTHKPQQQVNYKLLFAGSENTKKVNAKQPAKDEDVKHEFDGHQFQTFESNLTTHTMNNLTPRARDKHRLIKQIRLSFNKLKEPIKTTSEFYRIGKMLGKGAFGRVNLAIHKLCNQLVAVKSINKQFLSEDESSKKKVMQEVLILQKTRHDNIVRLYDSFETGKHIVFVMELCAGGDLLNYVRKRRKLKEDVARYIFKQVVDGLAYCHSKGIVHRDMKLDNILLDEQGKVKICDFGVSKLLSSSGEMMTEQCGTPAYIAPEILKDKGYKGFGVDVWSLGVCLYAMLFGTVPFKANNMSELHQLILKAKYSFKEETKPGEVPLSEEVKGLIKLLLEPNPDKRMDIKSLQRHSWLQQDVTVQIFSDQEIDIIKKDFTYQDMTRYKRNQRLKLKDETKDNGNIVTTEEPLFTEHALDSTTNALMKNCSTKSVILAPFNSTRTHIAREELDQDVLPEDGDDIPPLDIDRNLLVDKRVIKYAPRVKDINRQYEMNNNCELDNGVYNKFVKASQDNGDKMSDEENSLVTSINNEEQLHQYNVPLVSQNSDEEAEAELIKRNQMQGRSELSNFLQKQKTEFIQPTKDEQLLIDYEVVERVEAYGYPRNFIISSLENFEMNDAATNYFLLDKEKQMLDDQYAM